MTEYEGYVCAPGEVGKIAIIVSRFNKTITDRLLEGALAKLREHMVSEDQIVVVRTPGAFEIPTLAERFACDEEYAAIICLGCVIKGETPHDEYINSAVSQQLARIGAEYCLPVVFGLLTCNTVEQALARSGQVETGKDKTLGEQPGNKGTEAAEVALEMIDLFGKLPELVVDSGEDDGEFRSIGRHAERFVRGDFEEYEGNPDELVDLDDDEDDDEEEEGGKDGDALWFLHGSTGGRKPIGGHDRPERGDRGERRERDSRSPREKRRAKKDDGKGRHGDGGKKFKKGGDRKRK